MNTQAERVVAIIQARLSSTRFPGKVLLDVVGKPLLVRVILRARACRMVNDTWVATSNRLEDRALARVAEQMGARVYAGAADDVLDRYYQAARVARADVVVRVTADDPFKDPQVTDRIVGHLLQHQDLDYVSNTIEPTYPEGLDIEAIRVGALERAWREATLPSEREHVTPYIWKHPDRFRITNLKHTEDLSGLRWTVDYQADLDFARAVYQRFKGRDVFGWEEILLLLRADAELRALLPKTPRNEAYLRSIAHETAEQ